MKIIIKNNSQSITENEALWYVMQVVKEGRVSDQGRAYCFCTTFTTGIAVISKRNKSSDTFIIEDH